LEHATKHIAQNQ